MKKSIIIALTLLTVASCQKSEEQTPTGVLPADGVMAFTTQVAETRAGATTSNLTEFGISAINEQSTACTYSNVKATLSGSTWSTDQTMLWNSASQAVTFTAYAPYDETSAGNSFSIKSNQSAENNFTASDFLWAQSEVTPSATQNTDNDIYYDSTSEGVFVTLHHHLAKFTITVNLSDEFDSYTTNPVTAVTIGGTYASATIGEQGGITPLTDSEMDVTAYDNEDYVAGTTLPTFTSILIPQTMAVGELSVELTVDGDTFKWTNTSAITFVSNKSHDITLSVGGNGITGGTVTIADWTTSSTTVTDEMSEYIPDIYYNGSEYEIYSAAGLQAFASIVNNSTTDVSGLNTKGIDTPTSILQNISADGLMMNDIDLSGVCYKGDDGTDVNWTPIGTNYSNPYKGTFDGGGYLVSGLYINTESDYQGLFGSVVYGGTIQNVGVDGSVTGGSKVGGVVGYSNYASVTSCYNTSDVSGSSGEGVGGIAGYITSSTITSCYNTGNVNSSNNCVGGLVGRATSYSITSCYNTGNISGGSDVGGVVGYSKNSSQITSCYNTGNIYGLSGKVGGIVGHDAYQMMCPSYYTLCYSSGAVSSKLSSLGGIIGYYDYRNSFSYCYYDNETVSSGTDEVYTYSPSIGVNGSTNDCGLKTTNMKGAAETDGTLLYYLTIKGGSTVWKADTNNINNGYPILSWQE